MKSEREWMRVSYLFWRYLRHIFFITAENGPENGQRDFARAVKIYNCYLPTTWRQLIPSVEKPLYCFICKMISILLSFQLYKLR